MVCFHSLTLNHLVGLQNFSSLWKHSDNVSESSALKSNSRNRLLTDSRTAAFLQWRQLGALFTVSSYKVVSRVLLWLLLRGGWVACPVQECVCVCTCAGVHACAQTQKSVGKKDIDWQTVKINNWNWIIWHQTKPHLPCVPFTYLLLLLVPSYAVLAFCWFPYVILL